MANSTKSMYHSFNKTRKSKLVKAELKPIKKSGKTTTPDLPQFADDKKSYILKDGMKFDEVYEKIITDEEVRSFYSVLRDAVIKGGYILKGKTAEADRKKLKKLKFRKRLKRIVIDALFYKHAFVNLVSSAVSDENIAELAVLDVSRIAPYMNRRGTILKWGYFTESPDNTSSLAYNQEGIIELTTDEICHIEIDESSPKFWGTTDIETLKDIMDIKDSLITHLKRLLEQDWFRPHFHGKGVGENDIQGFLEMIYQSMDNPTQPITTVGEEDMEAKRFMTEDVFLPIIEMLREVRNKILTLIRVPPIIAGTVDNSNRSNSDVQAYFAFNNRVKAIQEDLEDDINGDLFPKLGIKSEFMFPEVTNRDLMDITDVVIKFISAGADKKIMNNWLVDKGYDVPKNMLPSKEEELKQQEKQMNINQKNVELPQNSDLYPSRQKQDNSNDNNFGNANEKNRE